MAIKTIEDLLMNIKDHYANNLNTEIAKINTERPDEYVIPIIDNYTFRESSIARENYTEAFVVLREDVQIKNSPNSSLISVQNVDVGCFALFYDDGTDLNFIRALRYEDAVFETSKTFSRKELGDIRVIGKTIAPFIMIDPKPEKNPKRKKHLDLLAAGIILNLSIGG